MLRLAVIATTIWLMSPLIARANGTAGAHVSPAAVWRAWNWDGLILFNVTLLGVVYALGLNRLRKRKGVKFPIHQGQIFAHFVSLSVLWVALISPLHPLSEELAAAHMVQHMLLMMVAAPLFVFGSPGRVLLWGLEPRWRPVVTRWFVGLNTPALRQPFGPWLLHAAALWFWHWPPAYQAALTDPLVHDAQHLSFFGAACLYWRGLLDPIHRRRLQPLTAIGSLFATSLQAMLLGIFLALSPDLWYDHYRWRTAAWGLAALEDQQWAGFIMWMPACLVYPALAAVVMGRWLLSIPHLPAGGQPLQEV